MFKRQFVSTWKTAFISGLTSCITFAAMSVPVEAATADDQATAILQETGTQGGLIVHLGCGDGRLTTALYAGDRYLVHGLETDGADLAKAKEHIEAQGCYGPVSVDTFDGEHLPYSSGLVNLLVAEDLGNVPTEEVMRVLSPLGTAYVKTEGKWTTVSKPWPDGLDEWTHFLHDASNNAVARDTQVGPPSRLKWICDPLWARSHEFNSSLCAMVTAEGRLFYIFDKGLTGVTGTSTPERWTLIARDAFNGLLLWERPLTEWGTSRWKNTALRSTPATLPRRLVAQGGRVFVTLGYNTPVSALDAATGQTLITYEATEGAEEIRVIDTTLLFRGGARSVAAVDVNSGKKLWEAAGNIRPLSLAAQDGKVFYQDGPSLVCLELANGKQRWRVPGKQPISLLIVHDDLVITSSKQSLQALSVDSGETVWSVNVRLPRNELFVAADRLWHWEGGRIAGRDLGTGSVANRLDTDDVFTPGHHLRCYQSKATERFLITPNRGIEFLSVTGGLHTQADWVRGPCRFGIMPANGLLYSGPDPCFCYPGVKVTGFTALASEKDDGREARDKGRGTDRLTRGPAYGSASAPLSALGSPLSDDWPTYRHDARRTGATACEVGARVSPKWQVGLQGRLTPPVVAAERVYVAVKDAHAVHALHTDDGRRLWQFTAAGRIDSPPTVHGDLVLFGCADGRVYCLRASDGELVWRFQAAPSDERILAFDQLESPWRVHGSVLVKDGVAYFTAGRSTYLDGGIRVFGLEPGTGKVLYETCLDDWARTREDAPGKPFVPGYHMEGAQSDVLVSQGDSIYLGQVKFDAKLVEQEVPYVLNDPNDKTVTMDLLNQPFVAADEDPTKDYETHQRKWIENTQKELVQELRESHGGYNLGHRRMGLHVLATGGFLDDSWFNRTYWTYSTSWPGFYLAHRASKTGQLLVVGPEKTYAVQAFPSRNLQSPLFTPGEKGYLLFADENDNEPVMDDRTRETTKGWGFTRMKPPVWHDWVRVRIRGMVLTRKHLFVAGPPDVVDPTDPMAAFEGRKGAVLRVHSALDGKTLAEQKLDAPPVFDGLIAASGRLFVSTTDGQVVCLGRD